MSSNHSPQWNQEPDGLQAVLADIAALVRENPDATMQQVNAVLGRHNRAVGDAQRRFAKKHLLPGFLKLEKQQPNQLAQWGLDDAARTRLFSLLRMKPRRTASGVATITVLTKPWPCSSNCDYCPNDIRMPKSYLADEPACQRAERNFFDPYLQVHARLHTLNQMGHPTDKVELIVLGGTWSDYPLPYQIWFMEQLFTALNDGDSEAAEARALQRRQQYRTAGFSENPQQLKEQSSALQQAVTCGNITYNQAIHTLYGLDSEPDTPQLQSAATAPEATATANRWRHAAAQQTATWQQLIAAQTINETAGSRCVGLVVETRPTLVNSETLTQLRAFGCTKVQMGIQTLNPAIAAANHRRQDNDAIARAFALLRRFGFKIHAHFMANLQGATPSADREDFRQLVEDARFQPDEVKLYPCVLVAGTALEERYHQGIWQPYPEDELVRLLANDVLAAPPYLRVSRMIRDISAPDIMAGSKKTNLRQMVENHIRQNGQENQVREIRFREIAGAAPDINALRLETVSYHPQGSQEHFLQWVTPEGKIAGFLRLSLPSHIANAPELPDALGPESAMIREVHVYGTAAEIHQEGQNAQHVGLGRALVARACEMARDAGFQRINVISAVGTREYYRSLGFADNGLYLTRQLGVGPEPGTPPR